MNPKEWSISPPTYSVTRKLVETKRERLEGDCILITLGVVGDTTGRENGKTRG